MLVHWAIHLCGLLGDSNENKPLVGAEEEEVAKMGCPSLGEHTQVEVIIEESYEFKVSVCVCAHTVSTYWAVPWFNALEVPPILIGT